MIRAGVFIGVDQTGGLQKLNDAAAGARRMHQWALAQGMPDKTHAKLITDEHGKVTANQIFTAIQEIIDGPGVDQLIVYFAGHGVNINFTEMWLLSDAPRNPNEAVNLKGSVELARYCGIGHVAFISDACRVAPEGIQAGGVRGQEIFPNEGGGDRAKPVDQFFACVLGRTAAEIKDPAVAAANFSALYTEALLEGLNGDDDEILQPSAQAGDTARYVNPDPLQKFLAATIPAKLIELKLEKKVNQSPDAILMRHDFWMSRITRPPMPAASVSIGAAGDGVTPVARSARPRAAPRETLRSVARTLVSSAVQGPADLNRAIVRARASETPGVVAFTDSIEQVAAPFGPDHFETQCGIKVRGARVVAAHAPQVSLELLAGAGDLVRIHQLPGAASSVLLEFDNGRSALVPALREFIAGLTFENGELIDVAYEPSANTWRWDMYAARAQELRALRATAAAASRQGRFRLDAGAESMNLARQMQYAKGIDPTFAIYAAYAYHDLQALDRVREMSGYLKSDIGVTFFDLSLLGRDLLGKRIDAQMNVVPFVPLLSQGWALLRANRIELHPKLAGLEGTLCDSLWSLYLPRGTELLKDALATGEVR